MQKRHIGILMLVTALASVLRSTVVIFNMESGNTDSYYLRQNFQTVSCTVFVIICLLGLTAMAIYVGRGRSVALNGNNNVVFVTSCMLAFVLAGVTVIYFYIQLTSKGNGFEILDLITALLALASAAAILANCRRIQSKNLLSLLALAPLAWTILRLISDFIKTGSAPLLSSGAYHILSLTFLVMYFLCEGKAHLSRGGAALYFIFGYGSVFMLALYAIPNVLMHCLGFFAFDYDAALSAMDIVICGYLIARMATATTQLRQKQE